MSKFSTSKKKIETIWNTYTSIENELNLKENEIRKFFTERYKFKQQKNLYDSDWIAKTPTASASVRNVTPAKALSETVALDEEIDITIPDYMLPFVNISLMTKTIPEVQAMGLFEYVQEGWETDYIEAYGNGTNLIYKGFPRSTYYEYDQDDLDDGRFQENYTKKVYRGTIEYTSGGDEYKIHGTVIRIEMYDNLNTGCGSQNYDYFDVYIDPGYTGSKNYAKFHDLTSDYADMTGILYHFTFSTNPSPPPSCEQNYPVVQETDKRLKWYFTGSNVDHYRIKLIDGIKYKKIGGSWVYQSSGTFSIDSDTVTITSRTFTFVGYWIFYSPDTYYLFGTEDSSPPTYEGVDKKIELANLPEDPNRYWNTITFKRNPEPRPEKTEATVSAIGKKQILFFKISKSTETETKYRLFINGTIVLSALSSIKNPPPAQKTSGDDRQVVEYSDTYSKSGSSYTPSESHTLKIRNYWGTAKEDMEYRIKVDLINPLYWKEIRKYKS